MPDFAPSLAALAVAGNNIARAVLPATPSNHDVQEDLAILKDLKANGLMTEITFQAMGSSLVNRLRKRLLGGVVDTGMETNDWGAGIPANVCSPATGNTPSTQDIDRLLEEESQFSIDA